MASASADSSDSGIQQAVLRLENIEVNFDFSLFIFYI
jgi:hypothetical protein